MQNRRPLRPRALHGRPLALCPLSPVTARVALVGRVRFLHRRVLVKAGRDGLGSGDGPATGSL